MTDGLANGIHHVLPSSLWQPAEPATHDVALRLVGFEPSSCEELSYGELGLRIHGLARAIASSAAPGDRALLLISAASDYAVAFLACLHARVIPVGLNLVEPRRVLREIDSASALLADADPSLVIGGEATLLRIAGHPQFESFATLDVARQAAADEEPVSWQPSGTDVGLLHYAEDSNGELARTRYSHEELRRQVRCADEAWSSSEPVRVCTWLALTDPVAVVLGVLLPLATGGTATLLRPDDFVAEPGRWLQEAARQRANVVLGYDWGYARAAEASAATSAPDLSGVRWGLDAGSLLRAETRESLAKVGLPDDSLVPVYAPARLGSLLVNAGGAGDLVASFDTAALAAGVAERTSNGRGQQLISPVDAGALEGLTIVDLDSDRPALDGRVGEVSMRAGSVADGGQWLRTGDLGFASDDRLYVCGPICEAIRLRGRRHPASGFELTVERDAAAVAVNGVCAIQVDADAAPVLLAEVDEGLTPDELTSVARGIRIAIVREHRVPLAAIVLLGPLALPRTHMGEVQRRAASLAYLRGHLDVLHIDVLDVGYDISDPPEVGPATVLPDVAGETPTIDDLRAILGRVLGDDPSAFAEAEDLIRRGLDSIGVMRITNELRRMGFEVKFAELMAEPSLHAWSGLLSQASARPWDLELPDLDPAEPFALTPVQHAYWIGRGDEQTLGGVGCHFYVELDGRDVRPERLERAVRALAERHSMLRIRLLEDGRQEVLATAHWPGLTVNDWRHLGEKEIEAGAAAQREELSHRRLKVDDGEVFDVQLTLLPDDCTRVHLNVDLLVADVQSIQIMLGDLADLYADPDGALLPIGVEFAQYLAAQDEHRAETRTRARAHWLDRLDELPGPPELPLRIAPEHLVKTRFARRSHWLSPGARMRMAAQAREHGVTLAMTLAAAYVEVIGAWSAQPRFLINVPLFDREELHPDVPRLVADFTNLLLLSVDAGDERPFVERVMDLQTRFQLDASHLEYTGVEVLRDLARAREGHANLAPVVFTSALGMGDLIGENVQACLGRVGWMLSQTPQVWLDHQVVEQDGGLLFNWDAVEELFSEGVLDAMHAAFARVLEWLETGEWDAPLPDLLPETQMAVRERANATAGPAPQRLLHDGFFDWAAREPQRLALAWSADGRCTYGELSERARRLAGALQAHGVSPGDPVAITIPKGPGQVEAVLGVLAAGGVYVPVGVDQPDMRRTKIYASAGVRVVLTDAEHARSLRWSADQELVILEEAGAVAAAPVHREPDELAYVIYTSGSTGEPKGVEISHAAAVNTVADVSSRFGVDAEDRVLAVSALDFDLSVYDVFGMLDAGGAVILVEETDRRDAERWMELIRRWGVTVWNSVPALLDILIEGAADDDLGSLRIALVSGDWVDVRLPRRLRQVAPQARMIAMGGATEAAIWSNALEVDEVPEHWRSIPYGFPLGNQAYRAVDARGRDCPDWVPGELWIGGAGVAQGYRNDPEQTARQFLRDAEGGCWYRTGDRGRYWPDGTLEFLGRADSQVKIRGHRIELGEIEAALGEHPDVASAVALTVGERPKRLAAVVVTCKHEAAASTDELRVWLTDRLPAYMIPDRLESMPSLPLTPNAKINRRAILDFLTSAGGQSDQEPAEPPRGAVETIVAEVWADVLGADVVGRDHDFFELGGDSLLATRLISRLRHEGMQDARLGELFDKPRLADFAATVSVGYAVAEQRRFVTEPEHRGEPFPLTDAQRAYLFGRTDDFTLGGVGCHFFSEYSAGDLDLPRLEDAWNVLVVRHDMLRAVFGTDGTQRVLDAVPRFSIRVADVADGAYVAAVEELRAQMSHQVLDPATWPVFDLRAVRAAEATHLAISLDAISLDALSVMLLFGELEQLYADLDAGLEPLELSFRDYVVGTAPEPATLSAAEGYWIDQARGLPAAPQLPLAKEPAQVARPRFVRRQRRIGGDDADRIFARAREHGLTASTVLATALGEVLRVWSGQPHLTLNLTLFDRRPVHPDVNRVLGDFSSLLLVGYRPEDEDGFLDTARRLQREVAEGLEHGEVSAVWVLREIARQRGVTEVTMPVVSTSTIGIADHLPPTHGQAAPFAEQIGGLSQTPQVWLDHQVIEQDDGVLFNWDAVEELFPAGLLDAMFDAYHGSLRWLAAPDAQWGLPIPVALPRDQARVRELVNETSRAQSGRVLHDGFFDRACHEPERLALAWGVDGRVTYGELASGALRVAGMLQARGVRVGDAVAVTLPKGPAQIEAVMGILAVGAAYVPVGVSQPPARRERIYSSAGTCLVVTDEHGRDELEWPDGVELVCLEDAGEALEGPVSVDDDQLAYIIYTSGSTGEPKGVMVTHRAAVNTVEDVNERFGVGVGDRVLALSALDFDLSVYDVFGLLAAGGGLVLVEESDVREARSWLELIDRWGVTVWNTVPALLEMLLIAAPDYAATSLRLALVSGDWVPLDLRQRLIDHVPEVRLIALGGATEAAIWSNFHEVRNVPGRWRSIPYGEPLGNQEYRVVDPRGHDCPDWVSGELWIGGAGVAAGYRNDQPTTRTKFVEADGRRWYRTGDLGRYWPDGTLEFLGRTDNQVKIGGHRVELGEIEAALEAHPSVGRAVAASIGDPARSLAAAIVPVEHANVDGDDLRHWLADRVPSYMLPERFVALDRLPLTPNGKVDRRAVVACLIRVDADKPPHADRADAPGNELETQLAAIWADVLDLGAVGSRDDFVALGGDSLIATRLTEEIRARMGVDLSLRELFGAPTVAELARLVEAQWIAQPADAIEEGVV